MRRGTRRVSPVARCILAAVLSLTTPPEGPAASIGLRRALQPSPLRCGLGLRGYALSGPPRVHWRYGPATRLHPKDGLSMGFRSVGFPPACHSGYGASDCYPGGTDSRWTHQPFLDAQRSRHLSAHYALRQAPKCRPVMLSPVYPSVTGFTHGKELALAGSHDLFPPLARGLIGVPHEKWTAS